MKHNGHTLTKIYMTLTISTSETDDIETINIETSTSTGGPTRQSKIINGNGIRL